MHDKCARPGARIYVATSNPGKIRDFEGAAGNFQVTISLLPGFAQLPQAVENGATFEENARIKSEHYSRYFSRELVLADDSGLAVDALHGAPGVHSARYAAMAAGDSAGFGNSDDEDNNRLLISQLQTLPPDHRGGRFICVLAAARNGVNRAVFCGEVRGQILTAPRGSQGFGYDPLFFFPPLGKTFAEISAAEKAQYSHRGQAFRQFVEWYSTAGIGL